MLFIRQNGDDSRPKNAATCPAFLDEICAKFGRTMTRHILLSLQKQLSVVSIIFGPSKKTKYTGRQRLRKNRTQNGYDEKSNRQRSFKTVFLKVNSQNNQWIVSSRKCRLFFNIQAYVNQIGTYVQRDVSRNTKRKNKVVRIDRRTENESIPIGIKKNG